MNPGLHEEQDVRSRPVLWAVVAILPILGLINGTVWLMFRHYRAIEESRDVSKTQIEAVSDATPEPLLQVDPVAEWQRYSSEQKAKLETYGWASRTERRVRIPIRRAMELLQQRGLPATTKEKTQ